MHGSTVHLVVSTLTEPVYYLTGESMCIVADLTWPVETWYRLGDPLPESTWAVAYEP